MIWSWIICYFNIISQGWLWTLAFILQTSKFYYIQIWLFFQRTRTFTIIPTDYVISWISSKVGCEKIDITNILVYCSLKKSTSWKNKLGFTLILLFEFAVGPGTFPFVLSINIWRQFRTWVIKKHVWNWKQTLKWKH